VLVCLRLAEREVVYALLGRQLARVRGGEGLSTASHGQAGKRRREGSRAGYVSRGCQHFL